MVPSTPRAPEPARPAYIKKLSAAAPAETEKLQVCLVTAGRVSLTPYADALFTFILRMFLK